jgi:hypothetical protein
VNREPDKVISFREMTSRLKRVGQSDKIATRRKEATP